MTHTFPSRGRAAVLPRSGPLLHAFIGVLLYLFLSAFAHAHGVTEGDKGYIQEISGTHLLPFTQAPVADTWGLNQWMARAEREHFAQWRAAQSDPAAVPLS